MDDHMMFIIIFINSHENKFESTASSQPALHSEPILSASHQKNTKNQIKNASQGRTPENLQS